MKHLAATMTTPGQRAHLARRSMLAGLAALACLAPGSGALANSITQTFAPGPATGGPVIDHAAWSALLKTYVVPGKDGLNRVAYRRFKAEGAGALKSYLDALEKVDVTKLNRSEQFAYWANLYNAKTIDIVLSKYPVKSIKDISLGGSLKALVGGGPWSAKVLKVNGLDISLDDIEHVILRPLFKDPRVHYAVNCASVGCPNLGTAAFTGAGLEAELDAAAKAFVNAPRGLRIDGGKAYASKIYSWFQADFGGSETGVLAHLRKYAEPAVQQKLEGITRIADYEYDWALNDAR